MSLSTLLAQAHAQLSARFSDNTISTVTDAYPSSTLFFSLCDGETRARVHHVHGTNFSTAWKQGVTRCQQEAKRHKIAVKWLRIDWITEINTSNWGQLTTQLSKTKRNYFRFGLAFDNKFNFAFLEQELNANAMLYAGSDVSEARLNEKNFKTYASIRYGKNFSFDFLPESSVYIFSTEGIFLTDETSLNALPRDKNESKYPWLSGPGLNGGRRQINNLNSDQVFSLIDSSANFLARQVKKSGQFVYGHFPCFGREIATYNALRHASSIYSMLEGWELTRREALLSAINRAIHYLTQTLIRTYTLSSGEKLSFVIDIGDEIKLGANAVSLLTFVKYTELTHDNQFLTLMEQLALGIAYMQDKTNGQFVHVLHAHDLSTKESFRIIYYDGEAAFGLMRLYGLTKDSRWIKIVEQAFDYFLKADHWRAHDHWLSYCANELTRYKPDENYFRFGVQNVTGHLDFILQRETTYPTLLELSMAFEQMLGRISELPSMNHVLEGLDIDKFYRALNHRAHYLLNGFFWPEFAMYFAKPNSVVGSFFIRHHTFRVRIDDIEHYLSGYVAYWKYLQRKKSFPPKSKQENQSEDITRTAAGLHPEPASKGPVAVWGG
ncbi:MAG: hypothetical protein RLY43_1752, partial [Bacteroidota bacterium]